MSWAAAALGVLLAACGTGCSTWSGSYSNTQRAVIRGVDGVCVEPQALFGVQGSIQGEAKIEAGKIVAETKASRQRQLVRAFSLTERSQLAHSHLHMLCVSRANGWIGAEDFVQLLEILIAEAREVFDDPPEPGLGWRWTPAPRARSSLRLSPELGGAAPGCAAP